MTTIPKLYGDGGVHGDGTPQSPALGETLHDMIDDLAAVRTGLSDLLTKLDADFTAQNAAVAGSQLDVDYASSLTPAALKSVKGS